MKSPFLNIGLAIFLTTVGTATSVGNLPINLLLKEVDGTLRHWSGRFLGDRLLSLAPFNSADGAVTLPRRRRRS